MAAGLQSLNERPVPFGVLLEFAYESQQIVTVASTERFFKLRPDPRVLPDVRGGGVGFF